MRRFYFLLLMMLVAIPVFGQGVPFAVNPPAPNAQMTVCTAPAVGGNPCTNTITIYTTAALTTQIPQPAQIGPTGDYTVYYSPQNIIVQITGRPDQFVGGGGLAPNSPGIPSAASGNVVAGIPTNGLIGWYQVLPTESAAALVDYSGQGNNGTGTVGTAPTITATTGGVACNGAGASTLPSALNSGVTFYVFMKFLPPVNAVYAPFIGNGNLSAGHAQGLLIEYGNGVDNTGVPPKNTDTIVSFGNGANGAISWNPYFGIGSMALISDASADRLFINNQEIQYQAQAGTRGTQTTGFFQLCGAAAGSGSVLVTYMPSGSIIYQFLVWNRQLSTAELSAVDQAVTALEAGVGVVKNPSAGLTGNLLVVHGDSISTGFNGLAKAWPSMLTLSDTYTLANAALVSQTAQTLVQEGSQAYASWTSNGEKLVHAIWIGTNDVCVSGTSATITAGYIAQLVRSITATGGNVLLGTMISRNSCDTQKNALNAFLRQDWSSYGPGKVYIADIASNALLGADGAGSNATWFQGGAGVHPTESANYNIDTPIWQAATNAMWGNHSYSAANNYGSAGTAATTITAASEATNTMTFSATAFPTGQFKAGAVMFCTGITPAGYNSPATGWLIQTANTTTVTAYNGTTGLGAGTVFGTCQAPSQQDVDEYSVLNFGTGSFFLEPCELWTGRVVHINNINASSSTIAGFGAETINGSGTFTLAAHTAVNLASVLTSASAAGCSWQTQ